MMPSPECVARFRADLDALGVLAKGKTLGIAYSGGPDSLALLLLAHAALPGRVKAATVDHGLRPESASEAADAAKVCEALGVPHEVLSVEVGTGNVQAEARRVRYAALGEWAKRRGVAHICTAHHADDQAETFLMRANRGSGLAGLAGVRAATTMVDSGLSVLRPLLGWRRDELVEIAEQSGFTIASDPSNEDASYDRVVLRQALARTDVIDVLGLAASARQLATMQDSIDAIAREENDRAYAEGSYRPMALSTAHRPAIWIEVVMLIAADLGASLSRSHAARMVEGLLSGKPVNVGGVQARAKIENDEPIWTFAPENPRRTG